MTVFVRVFSSVCARSMCYVIPYVWSILLLCNQLARLPESRHLPALCHEAFLALASSHTVVSVSS